MLANKKLPQCDIDEFLIRGPDSCTEQRTRLAEEAQVFADAKPAFVAFIKQINLVSYSL